jgi:hypothetical protein
VLALHKLGADLLRDRKELATAEVGADHPDGHRAVRLHQFIGPPLARLESDSLEWSGTL